MNKKLNLNNIKYSNYFFIMNNMNNMKMIHTTNIDISNSELYKRYTNNKSDKNYEKELCYN